MDGEKPEIEAVERELAMDLLTLITSRQYAEIEAREVARTISKLIDLKLRTLFHEE